MAESRTSARTPTYPSLRLQRTLLILAVGGLGLPTHLIRAASITPLGFLSTTPSIGSDASGLIPGAVAVAGTSLNGTHTEAFRYAGGTMVGYGVPGGYQNAVGTGISRDGTGVIGYAIAAGGETQAMLWQGGNTFPLGQLSGSYGYSMAFGVNGTASRVVGIGQSGTASYEAFLWEPGPGMIPLGDLPGGDVSSGAQAISVDGSVVVGYGSTATATAMATRWDAGGITALGDLPGGAELSIANALSSTGDYIVGTSAATDGLEAFLWSSGSMISLGDLAGGAHESRSLGVSDDGSRVVGFASTDRGQEAMIWQSGVGMIVLSDVLSNAGINPAADGWNRLERATAISPDGRYISGFGLRNGNQEAFVVDLQGAPVPEAGTWAAIGFGGLGAAWAFRRRVKQ